jgi:erythromycin esterase-like protein
LSNKDEENQAIQEYISEFLKNLNYILPFILAFKCYCQNAEEFIKKHAIECGQWPNQKLYSVLKDYKVICIGEMHGTKEPADYLTGLVKTFISNGGKVTVGFEIPKGQMKEFTDKQDTLSLSKTKFFLAKLDGRSSEAWFSAIDECNRMGAKFYFFDNSKEDRDKRMFEKILECYKANSNSVILTLSGNVHNMLLPYKVSKTMGCYLKEYFGNKIFSINHKYNEGTMYNRTSEGLGLHTITPTDGLFARSTNYNSYFMQSVFKDDCNSAYFYTKTVTASLPKNSK